MIEKIVFPCAGKKNPKAGVWEHGGKKVIFVAQPEYCHDSAEVIYRRPDNTDKNWRQELESYNQRYKEMGKNPFGLCKAWELYQPEEYELLAKSKFGEKNVFILSAGWGLVRADYLLPYYDITFAEVKPKDIYKKRREDDKYEDFNQLAGEDIKQSDAIYFFGLVKYLPLYYRLTHDLCGRRVVFHYSTTIPKENGYEYKQFSLPEGVSPRRWHYECARRFIQES